MGGFITFLGVSRLISVPVIRYLVGLAVGYMSMALWVPLYGFTRMSLMGLRTDDQSDAEDHSSG